MTDGIVFIACGEPADQQSRYAMSALKESGNDYPTQIIGGDYGAANKQASRRAKVTLLDATQYDHTLYMDADTRARESLQPLFDILSDGWDMVMAISGNQDSEVFWHVGENERQMTMQEIGIRPLQLQCGVMAVAKNTATWALFDAWRKEWMRYSGEDQAAFVRALYQAPVRIWLLAQPWNGGAAVGHNWGALR